MASYFGDNYGVDEDAAKLKVKDILQKLVNADEVQHMKFDMVSGESVVLYFRKSDNDQNESPFHKWMIRQAIENCDNASVIHTATSGEALPDIELSNCYFEYETSLKKRTDDLEERITKFSLNQPMIIVVPNTDAAEKYQRLASDRVLVTTLKDFKQSIRSKARPWQPISFRLRNFASGQIYPLASRAVSVANAPHGLPPLRGSLPLFGPYARPSPSPF